MHFELSSLLTDDVLEKKYDVPLVILSVSIALLAAYSAFGSAERIRSVQSLYKKIAWNVFGSVAMGVGIWAMHFIGMLALKLPVQISYDAAITAISVLPAILASSVVLWLMNQASFSNQRLMMCGILLGGGIGLMHYTGMAAIRLPARMVHDPRLFTVSIVVAVILATSALKLQKLFISHSEYRFIDKCQLFSAIAMGGAVSGMHYTAMTATNFVPWLTPDKFLVSGISHEQLTGVVSAVTLGLIAFAIFIPAILRYRQLVAELAMRILSVEEGKARIQAIIDASQDGIVQIDESGRIITWSQRSEQIFGWQSDDVLGKDLANTIIPTKYIQRHNQKLKALVNDAKSDPVYKVMELEALNKQGEEFPIELTLTSLKTQQGQEFTGFIRDISLRKKAEGKLQLFAQVFSDSQEGIMITDSNGLIVDVNPSFQRITGYSRAEVIGQNANILNSCRQPKEFYHDMWQKLNEQGFWQGEVWNKKKNGDIYAELLTISALIDSSYVTTHYVGLFIDITKSKENEALAKKQREKALIRAQISHLLQTPLSLKERFESSLKLLCNLVGLEIQDKAGIFLVDEPNQQLHLFACHGQFSDEFIFKEQCINFGSCLCGKAAVNGSIKISDDCFLDHEHEHQFEGMTPHGHYIIPLKFAGKTLGVMFLYTSPYPSRALDRLDFLEQIGDMFGLAITNDQALQSMEKEKLNAEKANRAKSEFLSSMSHELRTPLNSILGFAQLMEMDEEAPLTAEHRESLTFIINSGKHLLDLINQVLELAAIEAGKLEINITAVCLHSWVEDCLVLVRTLAQKKNVSVLYDGTDDVWVMADPVKLKQVLLNLINNAIKYNHDGGSVHINWQKTGTDKLRLNVRDSGIGISKENQAKLFTAFNRLGQENSSIEGTGIGLIVTKELVEKMHGSIGFDSTEGSGSLFWFELPFVEENTASPTALPLALEEENAHPICATETLKRILYVEDNPANRSLIQLFFNQHEHEMELVVAENADQALLKLAEYPFDLILMDIHLPGVDGKQFTRQLKEDTRYRHLPVIAVTAAAMKHDVEANRGIFEDYLTKPIDFTALAETLKRHLNV